MSDTATPQPTAAAVLCGICHTSLETGEPLVACPECRTRYHRTCWEENRGCAVYGCSKVPPTEKWEDIEIPFSHWGADTKACPRCRQTIQAAAVRCRFCGAEFATANPEDARGFFTRQQLESRLPQVRTGIIWIFALALLTCTAPVAGFIALSWRGSRQEELKALPSLYSALLMLAVWIGLGQSAFMLVVVILLSLGGHR